MPTLLARTLVLSAEIYLALGVLFALLWFWAAGSPAGFGRALGGLLYGSLEPARAAVLERAMPAFAGSLGVFTAWWWASLIVCRAVVREKLGVTLACFLLAGIAAADLWRVDDDFYETFPVTRLTAADGTVRFLRGQPGPYRVLPLPSAYGPNDLMLHRIESVTGSQNFRLRWWDDLVGEDLRRLGDERLARDGWGLRERRFEDGGRWYRRRLRIHRWKDRVPEAGALFGFELGELGVHVEFSAERRSVDLRLPGDGQTALFLAFIALNEVALRHGAFSRV